MLLPFATAAGIAALAQVEVPRDGHPHGIERAVWAQLPKLADDATRTAAVDALVALGGRAAEPLALALRSEIEIGATPRAWGIAETLARIGPDAASTEPVLAEVAATSGAAREVAFAALAGIRGERDWTWATDVNANRIVALGPTGAVMREIDGPLLPWRMDLLPDGSFVVAEIGRKRVAVYDHDGEYVRTVGTYEQPLAATALPGGNVLVADGSGGEVVEVDPSGTVVWRFTGGTPSDAERLPDGTTLIADTGGRRVIFVHPDGSIVREIGGIVEAYDVDPLPDGRVLVADRGEARAVEFDGEGVAVWEIRDLHSISAVRRLRNGHTLVCTNHEVREYDHRKELVWSARLRFAGDLQRY